MPLPRAVARFNRRYTNRFIEPIVRRFPGFATVHHTGRQSGKEYRTPVNVFDLDGDLIVALTYGPAADWVQNVLAGPARIDRRGHTASIERTTVVDRVTAWPVLPIPVRVVLRCLRVCDFMRIELAEHRTG
ncbi:MAG: nitroreductase family deazaflavin-dependent oxidoreductase [Ilumatobacter sp.]|uniref:nitroreductase family deazaflavin-dependent oxidoreductase n=1 Tax=Ilumatobacter sp. TaxID=1967498 RepID=UPI00260C590B|nr:nitroreductase family deazaflavin-dependent oxidoreductase [Ilumatobacter sp.]MDJ0767818.1 nitroreductase family deazaflavin-dependent oxidoreductase [Ilumatobacter sp.]